MMIEVLYGIIVLLAVLKLSGAIAISWWMVFSPFLLILLIAITNAYQQVKYERELKNMHKDFTKFLKRWENEQEEKRKR